MSPVSLMPRKGPKDTEATCFWGEVEREARLFSLEKKKLCGVLSRCVVKEMETARNMGQSSYQCPVKGQEEMDTNYRDFH